MRGPGLEVIVYAGREAAYGYSRRMATGKKRSTMFGLLAGQFRGTGADLEFPVLREPMPPAPELSMDRYDEWRQQSRRDALSQAARDEALRRPPPTVPFVITD